VSLYNPELRTKLEENKCARLTVEPVQETEVTCNLKFRISAQKKWGSFKTVFMKNDELKQIVRDLGYTEDINILWSSSAQVAVTSPLKMKVNWR